LAEQGVTEDMYAHVADHEHPGYSEAERLAVEYAERFALDHLNLDDAFFERLHEHFSDAEILDLTICIADFLGFGRVTQVLKLDQECSLDPSALGGQRGGSR
jgi:alkylhydroperoxidase family enzyme